MSGLWINIDRSGGLGNRLFSRAHVYAAARELGAIVADWGLLDQARNFPASAGVPLPSYPLTSLGTAPELPKHWWLDPRFLGLARNLRPRRTGRFGPVWSQYWGSCGDAGPMQLDGDAFRQFAAEREVVILNAFKILCVPWLRKHADEVRRFFAPPQALAVKWQTLQNTWHQRWPVTVAVHMRGTDFRRAQGGRYYLEPTEYAELLRKSPAVDPARTLFLLFSDENFLANPAFNALSEAFAGLNHLSMQGNAIDDLVGIGSCDMIVGPATSTFSRWAAFSQNRPWAGVARPQNGLPLENLTFKTGEVPWGA
jgi:hypothetical protein